MSNQDIEDVVPSSFVEMTPSRPQQQGMLALLPPEILLKITGEPGKDGGTLPYRDLKGLAVSCSRLFHLFRPMYYFADGYAVFHSAVAHGDLEAIQRCVRFGAASHTMRELSSGCTCASELPHRKHRPFDSLLEHVAAGSVPINKCLDGLEWLLDEGFEANEQSDQPWHKNNNDDCYHMPELLVTILSQTTERARAKEIVEMIEVLQSYGYCLPYQMNIQKRNDLYWQEVEDPTLITKPLDVALRLHCPSSFLKLVLSEYERRSIDIKVANLFLPLEVARWAGDSEGDVHGWRGQRTNIGNMTWNLFLDIFHPSISWKEVCLDEAADNFQEKIQLLKDYPAVDSKELSVLQSILEGLRDIAIKAKRLGGLDEERDGKGCWHRLCEALHPFSTKLPLLVDSQSPTSHWDVHAPLHRFIFEVSWNPWKLWFHYQLQKPKFRAEMSFSWMQHDRWELEQDENGMWHDSWWNEFHQNEGSSRNLPKWQRVSFDGFVAKVEEQWLKLNPYYSTSTSQDSNTKA
ncbi:hypothetical protein QWA68_001986 [Fusarium oxysporum]|nr:hypothetical protein QWA68_001986 [Fusarium oxysporum]